MDTYDDMIRGLSMGPGALGQYQQWGQYTAESQLQQTLYELSVAARQGQLNDWMMSIARQQQNAYAALPIRESAMTCTHHATKRLFWGRARRMARRAYRVLTHWMGHEFGSDPACPMCHVRGEC